METSMMVINSDELKPYLRGESEGDSINDPSLLQDSNDDTSDQIITPAYVALPGDANPWLAKSVVRGPTSDLLGVLEELEREAEAEAAAGKDELWPAANPHSNGVDQLERGLGPTIGSPELRPVHSDSQKAGKQASFTSPSGGDLMQSLSAELPMPPPNPNGNHRILVGGMSRAREPIGQKAVRAGGKMVLGDSSTMPFKPTEPFNLERVAHQHLLDLALNDLSPPASEDGTKGVHVSSATGQQRSASHSATPGPVTVMRNASLQEKASLGQEAGAAVQDADHLSEPTVSAGTQFVPPFMPSAGLWAQQDAHVAEADQAQPSLRGSGIPTVLSIPSAMSIPQEQSRDALLFVPRPEQSRDALQKTIYSTISPTASGILANLNAMDTSMLSPRPSPRPGRTKALHASESTTLLPSPPGRASHSAGQFRTFNSPGLGASDMLSTTLSRIPRSPVDGVSQTVDFSGMSLSLAASKLPARRGNDTRASTHLGSQIPLSPAGSTTGSAADSRHRQSQSLTPRKRDVTPEKRGQAMEAATAELDKLAVMLKQMQEDIKAIPSEPAHEASHPLPTSPAPPHAQKSLSQRRSMLDAVPHNMSRTPHEDAGEALPGGGTPDNESQDKVEKMQETSTTVTVAGAPGVRKPLHDAVAEEAEQGFGQVSEGLSEVSEGVSGPSVKRSGASVGGLSKTSVKRSEASEGVNQVSGKRTDSDAEVVAIKPRQQATSAKAQAKGKTATKSRSKLPTENSQQAAAVGREKRHIVQPRKAEVESHGNEQEGHGPAADVPNKVAYVEEVNSACLQPSIDDLVRVAVGKTAGKAAVVVHASTPLARAAAHNDLEQAGSFRGNLEHAAVKPQPQELVQHKEDGHGSPFSVVDRTAGQVHDKHVDAPDPPPPKCGCCFM